MGTASYRRVLLVASFLAAAPFQTPQFVASVDVLQFQVQVFDEAGAFVSGLIEEDFLVTLDGAAEPPFSVYEVDLNRGGGPNNSDAPSLPEAAWRQWVLVFDAAFNSPRGVREAQGAARSFLDRAVLPDDLVGVVGYNTVDGVRLLVPLTHDRRQVREAIDGLGLTSATRNVDRVGFLSQVILGELAPRNSADLQGPNPTEGTLEELARRVAQSEFGQYQSLVAGFVEQMGVFGEMLQVVRGRKNVIFFTQGFEDRVLVGKSLEDMAADRERIETQGGSGLASVNPEETYGSADVRAAFDSATAQLRAADAVLHMFDVSGLSGGTGAALAGGLGQSARGASVSFAPGRSSLTAWADGTGGSVTWNENDLAAALRRLELANRRYYVLAVPTRGTFDTAADIKVEVTREGVRIGAAPTKLARARQYADMTGAQRQAQLAEFIAKGIDTRDLDMSVAAIPYRGIGARQEVALLVEIPWSDIRSIAADRGDGKVSLDLLAYVVSPTGAMTDLVDRRVELPVAPNSAVNGPEPPLRIYDLLWALPGSQEIRVVLRDSGIGRITSSTTRVDVPDVLVSGPWISGPVVVDSEWPGRLLKAFDHSSPPERRSPGAGPIPYPFAIGPEEITPSASGRLVAGRQALVFLVANGLREHPFTGRPLYTTDVQLIDALGRTYDVTRLRVDGEVYYQPRRQTSTVVLSFELPAGIGPGPVRIVATLVDHTSGAVITGSGPGRVVLPRRSGSQDASTPSQWKRP